MASNQQMDELNAQLIESKLTIEGLEKERDFYFGKLRDIEVLCQVKYQFVKALLNDKCIPILKIKPIKCSETAIIGCSAD